MALSLVTGSAQTANCATTVPLYPATVSFAFAKDDPGEAVYQNVDAALDQPNSIRYAVTTVSNLFKGTPLTPTSGQRVDGLSMLVQVMETWKIDDAADALAPYYFPVSAHMVLKVPNDALVTSAVVGPLVRRLLGAVYRNGTDSIDAAINPLLHGIVRF